MDRIYKKKKKTVLEKCSVSTQKQPLGKVHVSACCRCSLPSWLLVGTCLLVQYNCNNHYYYTGPLKVQQTAQMVGYCSSNYECWSDASVSDIHACRCKFNWYGCWLGVTVKYMANGQMQLLQTWQMVGCKCNIHGCWEAETVTDMHADSMQLIKTWLLVRCNCKIHFKNMCMYYNRPASLL